MDNILRFRNSYDKEILLHANFSWKKTPPNEVAILCHGFLSSTTNPPISSISTILKTPFVMFNFVGDGEIIPSYSACVRDLFDVVTKLHTQNIQKISLVGHSMGASVCLHCLTEKLPKDLIDKVILISMPYDILSLRSKYKIAPMKKGEEYGTISIHKKKYPISANFIQDMYTYNSRKALRKVTNPTLIIQGGKDKLLPSSNISRVYAEIFADFPNLKKRKKKKVIPDAGHLFLGKKKAQALALEIQAFLLTQYPKT